ncbi:MAG: hypothetical protein ACRD4R_07620 [Candidatus Acidiferrales bacterium]
MRRSFLSIAAVALAVLLGVGIAHSDEFKLKDGSTIVGSVVGYAGNSFKVKTSYGYALVEKDKIISIRISNSSESSSSESKAKPEARKPPVAANRASKSSEEPDAKKSEATGTAQGSATAQPASPSHAADSAAPSPGPANSPNAPEGPGEASPAAGTGSTIASVSQPGEANADQPESIREKVTGNTYINETYQFEMYKPPDWQVMDGARSVLPGAIAAMGTDDQKTYLVVGQQPAGESAAADSAAMEKRLSDILVDFRPLGDEHLTVSGEPVIAHRFRGSMDEHDWSGFMVFLPRGAKLYTIFGMTRADNDLVQIQENVLRRTISSFQFLPQS